MYFFLSPASFPWFLVVIGFFVTAWTVYYIVRQLGNGELTSAQRRDLLFDAHLRFQMALCLFCLLVWMFVKPWPKPWFIFVFSGAAVVMTSHYSICYVDWKRMWLLPQLQLYLNVVITSFLLNTFYYEASWWLWPASLWGSLILLQLIIFALITRRRIRLSLIDPEDARRDSYHIHDDTPLLTDFSHTTSMDDAAAMVNPTTSTLSPSIVKRSRATSSPMRGIPPGRQHHLPPCMMQAPVARMKQHQLTAPVYVDPNLASGAPDVDLSESDEIGVGQLVEYVSTPPQRSARFPAKAITPKATKTRPISMRVIHHDDQSAEVVEEGSLTGSDGIYIDVVHIPKRKRGGYG